MADTEDREPKPDTGDEPRGKVTFGELRRLDALAAAGDAEAKRKLDETLAEVRSTLLSNPAWQEQSRRISESFAQLGKLNAPKIAEAMSAWQKAQPVMSKIQALGPVQPVEFALGEPEIVEVVSPELRMLDTLEAMLDVVREQGEDLRGQRDEARKAHRWARINGLAAILAIIVAVLIAVLSG